MNDTQTANSTPDKTFADRVRALRLDTRRIESKEHQGNTWLPWLLCIVLAISWASVGIRSYKNGGLGSSGNNTPNRSGDNASASSKAAESGSASTTAVEEEVVEGKAILVGKGYIIPAHQISISPVEVVGRLTDLRIEEGQHIEKGEVLAVIDSTSYQADYDEANAQYLSAKAKYSELINGPREEEVKQMQAEIEESKALLRQYTLEYQRNKELRGNALALRDYEQAEGSYVSGTQRVRRLEQTMLLLWPREERKAQAKAEMMATEARLARAKFRLDNCEIRAPVSGTVLSKKAEIGNLINPVVGGLSTSLCDMADLTDLEVDLEIQERDIQKIRVGQACEIRADAFPKRAYEGRVDRILPIANRARGIIPVRVKIKLPESEAGQYLKPEMGATVTFLQRDAAPAK